MSLESLSALKQLVQVRDQGANIQNDNLETAQKQVQQVGTGEAKRVDELNLEKVKAEYEVELTKARVDRLQSQLGRENKAVDNAEFITQGVAVLSIGDKAMNFYADMNGAQKFGDETGGKSLNNRNIENGDESIRTKDGTSAFGYFKSKTNGDGEKSGDGSTAVIGVNVGGDSSVHGDKSDPTTVRVAVISKEKMAEALKEANGGKDVSPEEIAKAGGNPFAVLMQKDPAKAEALFDANSRDARRDESSTILSAVGSKSNSGFAVGKDNIAIGDSKGLDSLKANLIKNGDFASGMKDRVQDHFDTTGVSKGGVGAMDTLKYGANAVIGVVSDVSPFFQAYLSMKEQRDKTADELQAEIAKLAAGRKRLKALEDAIMSPGAGAEGSAAGQAAAA